MTDHREQNSSCPVTWEEEPRGFLTEWEATPLKPTEDAMQNDEAERLARDCKTAAWCLKGAGEFESGQSILTKSAALIRAQAARIAELEADLQSVCQREAETIRRYDERAEAAEAQIAEAKDYAETCNRLMRKAQGDHEAAEAEVARLREAQTKAATDVLAERQRQISAEGWTPGHDDAHMFGEMATAASSYAAAAGVEAPLRDLIERGKSFPENWPWSKDWWKPTTRRRDLVKAGALILAEIERLDRAALQPKKEDV